MYMKKIWIFPAYLWASLCIILIPVTFMGNDGLARQLAKLSFMKVNPIYSGGETDHSYSHDSLTITINKPVFEALIGESAKGFVQVRFSAGDKLPGHIAEEIDYDNDGKSDFRVSIDTSTGDTQFESLNPDVLSLLVSSKVYDAWIIRIELINPHS
jgi:hypothetical protein